jgi:hypothetical protein
MKRPWVDPRIEVVDVTEAYLVNRGALDAFSKSVVASGHSPGLLPIIEYWRRAQTDYLSIVHYPDGLAHVLLVCRHRLRETVEAMFDDLAGAYCAWTLYLTPAEQAVFDAALRADEGCQVVNEIRVDVASVH